MPNIRDLLARRTDLSTFVVHFTREYNDHSAQAGLQSILDIGLIVARNPFGAACGELRRRSAPKKDVRRQRCVCFTETPLEHLHLLLQEVEERRDCRFGPYGIAVTKRLARRTGINPVWYIDMTPGHEWLIHTVDAMVCKALDHLERLRGEGDNERIFGDFNIAKLAPFFEHMGTWGSTRKEFWWDREWRHIGDYMLPERFIVIAPEDEHRKLRKLVNQDEPQAVFIDAQWVGGDHWQAGGVWPEDVGSF